MAYRPGDLILSKKNDALQVARLVTLQRAGGFFSKSWMLDLETIACAGSTMKYRKIQLNIRYYSGIKSFHDLEAYPLRYDPDHESINQKLIDRGKRLFRLQGPHQKYYRGNANWARDPAAGKEDWYEEGMDDYPFAKFQVFCKFSYSVGSN